MITATWKDDVGCVWLKQLLTEYFLFFILQSIDTKHTHPALKTEKLFTFDMLQAIRGCTQGYTECT